MAKLKSDSDSEQFINFNCCSKIFMNLLFTSFLKIIAKFMNNIFYEDFRNNNIPFLKKIFVFRNNNLPYITLLVISKLGM